MVDQIGARRSLPPRAAAMPVTRREVTAPAASTSRPAAIQTEALTSDLIAACQAGVAPPGVRCPTGIAGSGPVRPPGTAEGTLLQIFGVPRGFTTTGGTSASPRRDADSVARELGTEAIEGDVSAEAAGTVQRQRPSPPPTSPR